MYCQSNYDSYERIADSYELVLKLVVYYRAGYWKKVMKTSFTVYACMYSLCRCDYLKSDFVCTFFVTPSVFII